MINQIGEHILKENLKSELKSRLVKKLCDFYVDVTTGFPTKFSMVAYGSFVHDVMDKDTTMTVFQKVYAHRKIIQTVLESLERIA